jgi:hypothetical protein
MNLLTSLHSVFLDEEILRREEGMEAAGLEEDLDATGFEDTSDGGGQDSKEEGDEHEKAHEEGEERHEEGAGMYNEGVGGDGSASGSTSSCRFRSSHLIHPPVAPCDDNRVLIVSSGDWLVSHTFVLCFRGHG